MVVLKCNFTCSKGKKWFQGEYKLINSLDIKREIWRRSLRRFQLFSNFEKFSNNMRPKRLVINCSRAFFKIICCFLCWPSFLTEFLLTKFMKPLWIIFCKVKIQNHLFEDLRVGIINFFLNMTYLSNIISMIYSRYIFYSRIYLRWRASFKLILFLFKNTIDFIIK